MHMCRYVVSLQLALIVCDGCVIICHIYMHINVCIYMYYFDVQGEISLDTLVDVATNIIVQEDQNNKVLYDMI